MDSRIEEIQSKAKAERAEVSALDGQLSDAGLRQLLKQATFWLDDAEGLLIRYALKATTPANVAMWINQAEVTFQMAVQRRKFIQQVLATYGPNAVSIGA